MPRESPQTVYVDSDGTITDQDTFYILARDKVGPQRWQQLEERLQDGTLTLREVLSAQARYLNLSLEDADALLAQQIRFDATFPAFVPRPGWVLGCARADGCRLLLLGEVEAKAMVESVALF